MTTTYGYRLRFHRESKGLTQEGLAQKAGTTVTTVATHERDEVPSPRMGMVRQLADALGISVGELLDDQPKFTAVEAPTSKAAAAFLEANPGLPPDEVAYVRGLFFGDGKPTDSTFTLALAAYRDAQRGVGAKARETKLPANVKRRKSAASRSR
jgi:transcriptional regulator with XRE-family HTH domain